MRVEEFVRILLSDNVNNAILERFDEVLVLIPELKPMQAFDQNNRYHSFDVLIHTLEVLKHTEADLVLRLSALFHDIGKPHTYSVDEHGQGHFYGHGDVSVSITKVILERLKFNNDIIDDVLELITHHDYPIYVREKPLIKLLDKIDRRLLDKLFALKKADILGQNPEYQHRLNTLEQAKQMIIKIK